jgi:hypothetical protein
MNSLRGEEGVVAVEAIPSEPRSWSKNWSSCQIERLPPTTDPGASVLAIVINEHVLPTVESAVAVHGIPQRRGVSTTVAGSVPTGLPFSRSVSGSHIRDRDIQRDVAVVHRVAGLSRTASTCAFPADFGAARLTYPSPLSRSSGSQSLVFGGPVSEGDRDRALHEAISWSSKPSGTVAALAAAGRPRRTAIAKARKPGAGTQTGHLRVAPGSLTAANYI